MATTAAPTIHAGAGHLVRVAVILALIMAGLTVADISLEKTERRELRAEAQRVYDQGSLLLSQGKVQPAVELLQRAHAIERENHEYQLRLIEALIAAKKSSEARPFLTELLEEEPNDGRVNLVAARLASSEGKIGEAEAYYHRAIYGEWPGNPAASRRAVRFELVNYLIRNGRTGELLAELLPLEAETGKDDASKRSLAHLFLLAGSPARSADLYRQLIDEDSADPNLYNGLGEAELALGDYSAALRAFLKAFHHRPDDASIRRRMEFASLMAGLDPTQRRLRSLEKYERSVKILQMAEAAESKCLVSQSNPPLEPAPVEKPPDHVTNEMAEEKLAQAEDVWRTRILACGPSTSAEEEPLRLIMARLAQ